MVAAYGIDDVGGVQILVSGLHCRDRAEAADAAIAVDGLSVKDRWGQVKPHPLASVARDARAGWLSALRALNLSIGEMPKPGRPPGRS